MNKIALFLALALLVSGVSASTLPSARVPDGLGVNIHFVGEPARDLDMMQAAGFRFIRMDFAWGSIERTKGVYNFSEYDALVTGLEKRGIRPIFILDYSNQLYEKGQSVVTEEGRQAFALWAATAAARYKSRNIVWELYNEPNIGFWVPQPSVDAYMALAKEVLPAVKKADPHAICIAPASSTIDLGFLEDCFKQGLLQLVDAVSVHPYRQSAPETVIPEYARLRALIARYRPDKPNLPIISGEWGYSTAWGNFSDAIQGQYLPRELMVNLSQGVPISIWYDWHDDGPDPKEPEHRFGTVTQDYTPKPSYLAMKRLTAALTGLHFVKRLNSGENDFLFLFSDGRRSTVAAWTMEKPHALTLFAGRTVTLTGDPQYIPVSSTAKNILAEAAWSVTSPSSAVVAGEGRTAVAQFVVEAANPFAHPIRIQAKATPSQGISGHFVSPTQFTVMPGARRSIVWQGSASRRDIPDLPVTVKVRYGQYESAQEVVFHVMNPLSVGLAATRDGALAAVIAPAAGLSAGALVVTCGSTKARFTVARGHAPGSIVVTGGSAGSRRVDTYASGDRLVVPIAIPLPPPPYRASVEVSGTVVADSVSTRIGLLRVDTATAKAVTDGDPGVPATDDLRYAGPGALDFTYEYGEGWKFVRIAPKQTLPVQGKPNAIGVWVKGDGKGMLLRMRFADATGRTFQADYGLDDFTDWRYMTARLDDPSIGGWGGTGDGSRIVYPIRIDTFILVDGKRSPVGGDLQFSGFHLVYKR